METVTGIMGSATFTGVRSSGTLWDIPVTGLASGLYNTITFTITDSSQRKNSSILTLYILFDPTLSDDVGPTITQESHLVSSSIVSTPSVTIVDVISDPSGIESVSWTLDGGTAIPITPFDGKYSFTATLTEGVENTITVTAVDAATAHNNTSIQTIILTYIIPPEITTDPTTANVCYGDSATVSIAANGTAPLTYLWLNDTTPVPGATGKSFEATSTMNLRYVVSNKAGSDTSKAAAVTVAPEFIATVAPTSAQQCTGGSATFTASVTGGTAASYVWYKQGSATPAGVAAELDLTATTANAGTYFCVVTGDNECSDTSNTVTFTKNEDVAVEVTGKKHHLRRQQCRSYRHPDRRSITHLPVVPGYPGGRDQQQQIHGDFCRSIQLRGDKQCRL